MSGGLDSVCFAAMQSAQKGEQLFSITFDYGQRARPEIARARYFSRILGSSEHRLVDIRFMKSLYGSSNALTNSSLPLAGAFRQNLVVPLRNALFLTIAASWASSIGARTVAYGAHSEDIANYPDCRPAFTAVLAEALNLADADNIARKKKEPLEIISPAMQKIGKQDLLKFGYEHLGEKLFHTWSCYSDGRKQGRKLLHCGSCESCINRKKAFRSTQIQDKTGYAS